jgi:hypothetical protein
MKCIAGGCQDTEYSHTTDIHKKYKYIMIGMFMKCTLINQTKYLYRVYMLLVVAILSLAACDQPNKLSELPVPKDHPTYAFYDIAKKGRTTIDVCEAYGGREMFPKDYDVDKVLAQGAFTLTHKSSGSGYLGISFMEGEMLLTMKTCAWKINNDGNIETDFSLPENQSELKEFLIYVKANSKEMIKEIKQELLLRPHNNESIAQEILTIPQEVNITENGLGLIWDRAILGDYTDSEIEAMKTLYDVPLYVMKDYCKPPVINWMRDFGYTIQEKLYTESGILILDFLVTAEECDSYNNTMTHLQ